MATKWEDVVIVTLYEAMIQFSMNQAIPPFFHSFTVSLLATSEVVAVCLLLVSLSGIESRNLLVKVLNIIVISLGTVYAFRFQMTEYKDHKKCFDDSQRCSFINKHYPITIISSVTAVLHFPKPNAAAAAAEGPAPSWVISVILLTVIELLYHVFDDGIAFLFSGLSFTISLWIVRAMQRTNARTIFPRWFSIIIGYSCLGMTLVSFVRFLILEYKCGFRNSCQNTGNRIWFEVLASTYMLCALFLYVKRHQVNAVTAWVVDSVTAVSAWVVDSVTAGMNAAAAWMVRSDAVADAGSGSGSDIVADAGSDDVADAGSGSADVAGSDIVAASDSVADTTWVVHLVTAWVVDSVTAGMKAAAAWMVGSDAVTDAGSGSDAVADIVADAGSDAVAASDSTV